MNNILNKNILVVGSVNTDMVVKTSVLPRPGETVIGGTFFMNPGGKGANQAVAAARAGGNVKFAAKVGNDSFGKNSLALFNKEGIDTSCMFIDSEHPSGIALITVDQKGENCIAVASGANANFTEDDIISISGVIDETCIFLVQLEIPLPTVEYLVARASAKGGRVILNPAPAQKLPDGLLKNIYCITPNETEAEILTGINVKDEITAKQSANILLGKGVQSVIITMGNRGSFIADKNRQEMIPCPKVQAVDTTAAGDVFNGALVVALAENKTLYAAAVFATKAAAISVTRKGAQSSAPYRNELNND